MATLPHYTEALSLVDRAHGEDERKILVGGDNVPYELHYARKSTAFLEQCRPDASQALRLAVRAQHFRRWEIPRSSYPMDRSGYLAWRAFLKRRQGEQVAEICRQCGLPEAEAERVAALIRKENLKKDEETQALEDVACLVFLDDQFEEFERAHDEEKIISILRKTWKKMSDRGHELAMQIPMSERASSLVVQATS
ncbi:MAG: hypothetical protein M1833_007049 [Piccolia ochrophora]|nr:MAG: hypothetical protein M1833_007049 [Piccolia ochrophora]